VQAISSEILLKQKQTNFTKGWLSFNVGNTVSYSLRKELENGYGDLGVLTGSEARQAEVLLLAHSASVAYRMKFNFFPTRNGFQLKYRF